MANHTFKFEVTGTPPTFQYDPTSDWTYAGVDALRFETLTGPFTLDLIRKDASDDPDSIRPFPPLTSTAYGQGKGATHFAKTGINDGLTPEQRHELIVGHQTAGNPEGFIAKYRYK